MSAYDHDEAEHWGTEDSVYKPLMPDKTPQDCTTCDGKGWTAEHARDMSCNADEHQGCPVQVQCEPCLGTGKATPTHPPDKHVPDGYGKCKHCGEHWLDLFPVPPDKHQREDRNHSALQIEIAKQLGYAPDDGYPTYHKVEETAPVQVVHRLESLIARTNRESRIDELKDAEEVFNAPFGAKTAREKKDYFYRRLTELQGDNQL